MKDQLRVDGVLEDNAGYRWRIMDLDETTVRVRAIDEGTDVLYPWDREEIEQAIEEYEMEVIK